jgi:trk system potassium uptake protein TrkH
MLAAIHNLAIVLAVVAVGMLSTALVGYGHGEVASAQTFLAIAALTGFVAGGVFFASRIGAGKGGRASRYLFVILAWTVPPLFAAIPLMNQVDGSFISAMFEAVSGATTTGASVFDRVGDLPRTVLLWRAELHWLGGFLTLVLIVTVLAPSGVGGVPGRDSAIARRVLAGEGARQWLLIRDLLIGYGTITVVTVAMLLAARIPSFDAFCLAMSAVSTGGFLPVDGGVASYANPLAEIILAVAMLAGATSIISHRMIVGGRWQALRDHRESYWLILVAIVIGLIFAEAFMDRGAESFGLALHRGLATGASLVSTTGMEIESGGFSALPLPLVLLVALVGGGAFSTAGGLRFFRIGGMLVESIKETRRLIYPHGIRPKLFGAREFDVGAMKAIWSLFTATLALLALVLAGMALAGIDFGGALAATVSAFSNDGGVYNSGWAEAANWPTFAEMPVAIKLLMAGVMIVGRLEIIAIVVAVSLLVWRP